MEPFPTGKLPKLDGKWLERIGEGERQGWGDAVVIRGGAEIRVLHWAGAWVLWISCQPHKGAVPRLSSQLAQVWGARKERSPQTCSHRNLPTIWIYQQSESAWKRTKSGACDTLGAGPAKLPWLLTHENCQVTSLHCCQTCGSIRKMNAVSHNSWKQKLNLFPPTSIHRGVHKKWWYINPQHYLVVMKCHWELMKKLGNKIISASIL